MAVVNLIDSYTEVSPSGTGLKILFIGTLPKCARKVGDIECYDAGRYFTITGRTIEGGPTKLRDATIEVDQFCQAYMVAAPANDTGMTDTELATAAVRALSPVRADDYWQWVQVGMAAKCAGVALSEWENWSTSSGKYVDGECARKWESFQRGGVGLGSLIFWAKQNGWIPPQRNDSKQVISNFRMVEVKDDEGNTKHVAEPRSMEEIIDDINRVTGGWPKRVDNMLFVDDRHGLSFFDRRTSSGLFGYLRRLADVKMNRGGCFASATEIFAEIERTAERFDAIENLPHEPPVGDVYYRGEPIEPGDGSHLNWFLDRFRPDTTIDRDLIQSIVMTAVWGGPAGCRPAFVITADSGRGVGKTKLAELIGRLFLGVLDVSAGEAIQVLKTRLLSPSARTLRTPLLDNVKTLKLSWAELESLITAPVISGRQLYVGEASRPNLLTWMITLNGVSLATDMAQRAVIVKLARGENAGSWFEETQRYVEEHRRQIIGDVIGKLRGERFPLAEYSRWATWEKDVLCRLPDPGEAQRVIIERQGVANCEQDEAEIIEDHFAEQLSKVGYCPSSAQVRIPVAVAARWFGWAVGETTRTATASKRLHQMAAEGQAKRLAPDPSRAHGRGFIWTGPSADVIGQPIANDLTARIAQAAESRDRRDGWDG